MEVLARGLMPLNAWLRHVLNQRREAENAEDVQKVDDALRAEGLKVQQQQWGWELVSL
jgi:hypothetical protein